MRFRKYLLTTLAGMGIGILLVHPLTLVISEFFHWHEGAWHLHWYEIPRALRSAYTVQHLPNAIVYGLLTTLVVHFWIQSTRGYRLMAEQSERFALIGREASTIVHDINNPLFGITVFTDLVCEGVEDAEKRDYCSRIKSSAERISGLVAEIKTLAAGERTMVINKTPVMLDELVTKAVRDLALASRLDLDNSLHREMMLDAVYFGRVLLNVLRNAGDAVRGVEGGTIRVTLTVEGPWGIVAVADNGPGIPPQIRRRLFSFGSTYGKKHGTGLGLYAARRIVEAHGGTIWAQDRDGGGTVIRIRLPMT